MFVAVISKLASPSMEGMGGCPYAGMKQAHKDIKVGTFYLLSSNERMPCQKGGRSG